MPNAWLNHVRQFRKQNRHLSYKQLLNQARNSYGGANQNQMNQQSQMQQGGANQNQMNQQSQMQQRQQGGTEPGVPTNSLQSAMQSLRTMATGGGVTGYESRSSLTRSASSVGGRRSSRSRSRKTRRHRR